MQEMCFKTAYFAPIQFPQIRWDSDGLGRARQFTREQTARTRLTPISQMDKPQKAIRSRRGHRGASERQKDGLPNRCVCSRGTNELEIAAKNCKKGARSANVV